VKRTNEKGGGGDVVRCTHPTGLFFTTKTRKDEKLNKS
jgi:hypothetical protein